MSTQLPQRETNAESWWYCREHRVHFMGRTIGHLLCTVVACDTPTFCGGERHQPREAE